jgi:propanol-preferring alcohol dehydrogenase
MQILSAGGQVALRVFHHEAQIDGAQADAEVKLIQGWAAGKPADSADTLRFTALIGVRPMVERYPFKG